jgi:hypothetical protein
MYPEDCALMVVNVVDSMMTVHERDGHLNCLIIGAGSGRTEMTILELYFTTTGIKPSVVIAHDPIVCPSLATYVDIWRPAYNFIFTVDHSELMLKISNLDNPINFILMIQPQLSAVYPAGATAAEMTISRQERKAEYLEMAQWLIESNAEVSRVIVNRSLLYEQITAGELAGFYIKAGNS